MKKKVIKDGLLGIVTFVIRKSEAITRLSECQCQAVAGISVIVTGNVLEKDLPKSKGKIDKEMNERKIIGHLIRYFAKLIKEVGIFDVDLEDDEEIQYVSKKEEYEENKEEVREKYERALLRDEDDKEGYNRLPIVRLVKPVKSEDK